MKNLQFLFIFSLSILSACGGNEFDNYYRNLPFEMARVERPSIPSRRVSLTDFGAVGDGMYLNTEAFAAAFAELEKLGGGHLDVPAGIWLTGPIELKSRTDLHLAFGAVVRFSSDPELYPIIKTSFEGLDTRRCTSPLSANDAHDISITGEGVFDGSGDAWRPLKKGKVTGSVWKKKIASGGVLNEKGDIWYPDEDYLVAERTANMNVPDPSLPDAAVKRFLRPVMVSLRGCTNVLMEGCTYQNSPAWNLHPMLCTNLIIKGVTVRNPAWSQNGDGIDIESCTNTLLLDSSFDCGDDGICIKSGKDEDGRRRGVPCKNLIIDGCTVYHGHGGFVVGSEMSGGVQNVKIANCRFLGTDVGLRFKSCRGRGGVVEGIWISDISMTDIVAEGLLFDLHYGGKSAVEALEDGDQPDMKEYLADETTPAFRDIHIRDVRCDGAGRAIYVNGLPEMPVRNIELQHCLFRSTKGAEINIAEGVALRDVTIIPAEGPALRHQAVKALTVEESPGLSASYQQ